MLAHRKARRPPQQTVGMNCASTSLPGAHLPTSSTHSLGRSRSERLDSDSFNRKWQKFTSLRKALSEADIFGATPSATRASGDVNTGVHESQGSLNGEDIERLMDAEDLVYVEKQLTSFLEESTLR